MSPAGAGRLSGLSVLIVEDEFLIAVDAQRIVEEAGAANAFPVNSLAAARERLADQPSIDLVILDMRLGEEDGGTLTKELDNRGIPFVIASGFATDHGGSAGVLTKPYRDTDLIEAILSAINGR